MSLMEKDQELKAHEVFKSVREGLGLTPEQMAIHLELDPTTIVGYEDGSRKLPQQLWFYSRFASIEGIKPSDVASVLRADHAPAWLFRESVEPRRMINPTLGVEIPVYIPVSTLSDKELAVVEVEIRNY